MSAQWTIIYYSHHAHVHADAIRAANPDAQLLLLDTRNDLPLEIAWRAGDRLLRNALKNEFSSILHDNLLIVEWDVLVTQPLPDMKIEGAQFSVLPTPDSHPEWVWWKEFDLLPEPFREPKIGGVPMGVFAINKSSMEKVLDPRLDEVFELDVFAEVRLPAVLSFCGVPLSAFDPAVFPEEKLLRSTSFNEVVAYEARFSKAFETEPGIYHPVKKPVTLRLPKTVDR